LTLLVCVGVAVLFLARASAPAGAGTYSSTLYLSGASSSVVSGGYQLVTSAGSGTPSTAPTSSLNCSPCGGNLVNASYTYRYTYVDASGGETAPSASSNTTTVSGGGAAEINVGSLPTGVHIRLYRTMSAAVGPWNLVTDLPNNSSATYLDNVAAGSLGGLLPQAQNRTTLVTGTGYYEYAPGNALTTNATSGDFAKVASPSFDGKGWVVDGSGGASFAAGTWTTTVKITSVSGNGTARLDVGMWIVDDTGAVVGSSPFKPLIDPTCTAAPCASGGVPGEYATANIATAAGTASAIAPSFSLPAFSLARNQHLYVQFWRHQTVASSGSTFSTLAAYDGVNQITHPASNAFPNVPALGSIAARVNAVPQLSATFSDPDAADTGTMSFQICSDASCSTVLPSGSGSSASGIANGASGTWTPPVTLTDGTTYYWRAEATDSAANVSGWSSTSSFVYDTTPPTVSGVTASNANGAYKAGQTIHVQVGFSEAVTVTGSPKLALGTTPARSATYASGSGSSTLTFDYTVQAGDNVATLDYTGIGALTLNGGTIADAATNNATLTLASPGAAGSLAANKSIAVDTVAPTAGSVTATNANGSYKAGQTIHVQVGFSEPVSVTGSPQLLLETGATDENATYASGSGSSTLTFDYAIQSGDTSADLDYHDVGALTLNGGTIADPAGNGATLTLATPGAAGSLAANKNLRVDTNPPGTPSVSGPADGSDLSAVPSLGATFSNSDAGDTGSLDFDLCSDAACSSIQQSSSPGGLTDGASRSWTPGALADGTYYWRVGAHDAVGNQSGWSAISSFTLDTSPPSGPAGATPADGVLLDRTPTLAATYTDPTAGGQTGSLDFEVCTTNACSTVLRSTTVAGLHQSDVGSWKPTGLADGIYSWRVRAEDSAGNPSAWTSAWTFWIDGTPSPAPVLGTLSGEHVNTAPQLVAALVEPSNPEDSVRMLVELCSDPACAAVITTGYTGFVSVDTAAGWQVPPLPDGVYYWRELAEDAAGNQSPWSAVGSFVVDTVPPAVPVAGGPAFGAIVKTPRLSPALDTPAGGGIEFQVCADAACATVLTSGYATSPSSGAAPSWTPEGLPDGTYFWRINAHDSAGNESAWSATMSFVLDQTPPSTPRALRAKVAGKTLTLRWQAPARAAHLVGYALIVDGRRTRILTAKTHTLRIKLRKGETRRFAVVALDAAGNVSLPTRQVRPVTIG